MYDHQQQDDEKLHAVQLTTQIAGWFFLLINLENVPAGFWTHVASKNRSATPIEVSKIKISSQKICKQCKFLKLMTQL